MIRLLGVELTRLRKRRAVVALVVAALLLPVLFALIALWNTRPISEADLQSAREQVQRDIRMSQKEIDRCIAKPRDYGLPSTLEGDELRGQCQDMIGIPRLRWYVDRATLSLKKQLRSDGLALVSITTVLMILAAATFIGHDWSSGSMSNQLLFEPRRQRVFWAKALAVMLTAFVVVALGAAIYWGGLVATMHLRDLPIGDGVLGRVAASQARAAALAGLAALGAFAVTNFFRSTVATLGILFAVMVAGAIVVSLLPMVERERFQLPANLGAWVLGEAHYYRHVPESCFGANAGRELTEACRERGTLGWWGSARYFGTLLLLAVVPSAWAFSRRDVP